MNSGLAKDEVRRRGGILKELARSILLKLGDRVSGRENLTLASVREDLEWSDCLSFSALSLMWLWMPHDTDVRVLVRLALLQYSSRADMRIDKAETGDPKSK